MAKEKTITNCSAPTVEPERMLYYADVSKTWWKPDQPFYNVLLKINRLRIPWVVKALEETGFISNEKFRSSKPLEGVHILDVGCGGGFATEAFAELGAIVVGIDPVAELIDEANHHLLQNPSLKNITYRCETIEDHFEKNREKYDVLFVAEVLVHVKDRDLFLKLCIECLKPGGQIFISAVNQTWSAWLLYVVIYEYIFRVMSTKTFRYEIMIPSADVENWLKKYKCRTLSIRGYYYNHFYKDWNWSKFTGIQYALHAIADKSV